MNIEQIALEVASEMGRDEFILTEFLSRCLSKLAEQAGEPVAYLNPYGGVLTKLSTGLERETFTIKLYTEAQYIAAQQHTAEACAKVCQNHNGAWIADVMSAIRNGEWRKYR